MIKGFPERLKRQRELHGYTQWQLAERLHVSPSIVSGYETGERTPSTESILALSYILNVTTDYLLGRTHDDNIAFLDISGIPADQASALSQLIDVLRKQSK